MGYYTKKLKVQKNAAATFHEIDSIGSKTITGNVSMSTKDMQLLKELAKEGVSSRGQISEMKNAVATIQA